MPATARALAHRLPWIAASGGWFLIWQPSTRKSGLLAPPYFAAPEVLIAAFADDWTLPAKCLTSSGLLLLVGYLVGSAVGLVTGLLMGWPPRADEAAPAAGDGRSGPGQRPAAPGRARPADDVPAGLLHHGPRRLVPHGDDDAGGHPVPRPLIDVTRTLGARDGFLVARVAIPSAPPDILTGLFTGLGTSLAALMTAELVGRAERSTGSGGRAGLRVPHSPRRPGPPRGRDVPLPALPRPRPRLDPRAGAHGLPRRPRPPPGGDGQARRAAGAQRQAPASWRPTGAASPPRSSSWACATSRRPIPRPCPAGWRSGRRRPGPWSTAPACSSWTSPSANSTQFQDLRARVLRLLGR